MYKTESRYFNHESWLTVDEFEKLFQQVMACIPEDGLNKQIYITEEDIEVEWDRIATEEEQEEQNKQKAKAALRQIDFHKQKLKELNYPI